MIPTRTSGGDLQALLHTQPCEQIAATFSLVGDKWSTMIVIYLSTGPCRFNQLKRQIGGITQRMLTRTLRKLEREGLVQRSVYPTNPPQVEYALTQLGQSLQEPIHQLGRWVIENQSELERARQRYDALNDPENAQN